MLVRDLLNILEIGTHIVIFDCNKNDVLTDRQYFGSSYTYFDDYLDRHIHNINTSGTDYDIELVVD